MRDDGLWLDADDVEFFAGALLLLDTWAKRLGYNTSQQTQSVRTRLTEFLESRAAGRADATVRPLSGVVADAGVVDATEAAEHLGLTPDAVRKACRTGRFAGVAQKRLGRWTIPATELERSA
ncbi:hypothetical protein A5792_11565 [Mycolicibacterium peregrinum]|uniref:Helix-turn-helix domain-containing protein n=1 Tax=Mycolicibacterium peregrinum TaxID=43304 RepID=A0A1A0REX3_MYCPR|nr:helix-turn-helix domain-containing protein [Mycolicibacterium peregrinum]OBB33060.1 hypothetical protein A5792_11565 [Mycolicibacterium peregrinum]